jgi:hypothetical protein
MKVYTITCHGGEYDDRYEYLSSIHATFEGAKKECIRLAEVENDKEAAELSKIILHWVELHPNLARQEWEDIETTFFSVAVSSDETDTFFKLTKGHDSGLYNDCIEMGPEEVIE